MFTAFLLFTGISGFSLAQNKTGTYSGAIVAHRGASGYAPENTVSAFDMAVDMGADFIELDVQMSKDGELVVIHDQTVDATTNGTGKVGDSSLPQLKQLDSGSFFHERFSHEKIPTLQEVMDRFDGKVGFLIELKETSLYPCIEQKVADLLSNYDNERIIVQSFEPESMRKFHLLLPEIPVGVLVGEKQHPLTAEQWDEISSYADYINYDIKLLDENIVKEIRSRNKKLMVWTIREKEFIERAYHLGVDGIITDYPDWF